MKVIIYIGHHKVGSTALQVFLSQNWLRLAQNGILYPSVESRGFSHGLAMALGVGGPAGGGDMNVREPHSALAYRLMSEVSQRKVPEQFKRLPNAGQMLLALRAQVRSLQPRAVILCSEAFANFGQVDPSLITRLCASFPDAEFEVYCALRRPDDYLISWHGQRLKVGERLKPLGDGAMANYYDTIHFNFRMVVEAWANLVPDARLIIRPYSEILAAGGSTEDFMARTGLDYPDDLIATGQANKSLPRAALEIVRRANHALPPDQAHALSQYFLNAGDTLKPVPNSDIEMFGGPLRAELAEEFTPIHAYLSDLTGSDAFFPDFAEMTKLRPVPEARAAAELLAQIDPQTLPNDALRAYITDQQCSAV